MAAVQRHVVKECSSGSGAVILRWSIHLSNLLAGWKLPQHLAAQKHVKASTSQWDFVIKDAAEVRLHIILHCSFSCKHRLMKWTITLDYPSGKAQFSSLICGNTIKPSFEFHSDWIGSLSSYKHFEIAGYNGLFRKMQWFIWPGYQIVYVGRNNLT